MAVGHTLTTKRRVISASRRTDIPRFYADWFMTRIHKGVVAVPNPNNADSISWQSLKPDSVDAIVFWTKDPRPLLPHLEELDDLGYRYYFQYTLTGYPEWLEPSTPHGRDAIDAFRATSELVGAHRVVWRYDPICFLPGLTEKWHLENHARLASDLEGFTNRCVISFLDVFRKTAGNLRRACLAHGLEPFRETGASFPSDPRAFGDTIGATGRAHGMDLVTCAEPDSIVSRLGPLVTHGRCIDERLLAAVGASVPGKTDPGQREDCGCVASREIGMYDSCRHGCAYCYATISSDVARTNMLDKHMPDSASLLGWLSDDDCPAPKGPGRPKPPDDDQLTLV